MSQLSEDEYLAQFDPHRDTRGWVSETPSEYAARMQASLLPEWPAEVLVEWLHRHAPDIYTYAFLRYERFAFHRETWPLERIPGPEVFADPRFQENFSNVEERAKNPSDWLPRYMLGHGTWNTPIVLLETPRPDMTGRGGWKLNHPLHLLEGHRRLSFLLRLRTLGKAAQQHDVWIVRLKDEHAT